MSTKSLIPIVWYPLWAISEIRSKMPSNLLRYLVPAQIFHLPKDLYLCSSSNMLNRVWERHSMQMTISLPVCCSSIQLLFLLQHHTFCSTHLFLSEVEGVDNCSRQRFGHGITNDPRLFQLMNSCRVGAKEKKSKIAGRWSGIASGC